MLKSTFRRACTYLGFTQVESKIVTEYKNLIKKINEDAVELCDLDMSSPVLAWAIYLKKYEISDDLRKILLSAIIIPMGTAQGNLIV